MRCFSCVMLSFVDKLQRFSTVARFRIQGFCYLLHTEKATALSRKDKKKKKWSRDYCCGINKERQSSFQIQLAKDP